MPTSKDKFGLPIKLQLFGDTALIELQTHVAHVRRLFDWPGIDYHDHAQPVESRFNRWCYYNLPSLMEIHHSKNFIEQVESIVGEHVKPTYVFLSMYGKDGVCPLHTDRPQCAYTVDLCLHQNGRWPLYVNDIPYDLEAGESLIYSGSTMPHYRNPMPSLGPIAPTYANLAFFHFVPRNFMGATA